MINPPKKIILLILILLLLIVISENTSSQPFPSKFIFEKFSVEHGLSSSAIYSILLDKTGFLWFGTENGLNRYDGYSFKIFKHNPEDENSISDNFIWDICEDQDGNLWFATNNGLNKYDPVVGKFTRYQNNPNDSNSISGNEISSITLDAENNLWIGTWSSGLNKFNIKNKKFVQLNYETIDLKNEVIWYILKDRKDNIWIGTESGNLLRYNWVQKNFSHFNKGNNETSFSINAITSICEDKNGYIWISTYGSGLSRYDYKSDSFIHFRNDPKNSNSIGDNFIWKIFEDSNGLLWIGGVSKGITVYNYNKNSFIRLNNNNYDIQSISSDYILDIFEDRSNNLWIGTVGAGVNKLNLNPQNFYQLKNEPNNSNSLNNNFIFTICEDRNSMVWIGTFEGGINKYDPVKNKFTFYKNDPADKKSLSSNHVRKIFEDKDGTIWAATYFGGLNKFDKMSGSFIKYRVGNAKELTNDNIREIFEDSDKNLWLGSHGGGLIKFDRQSEEFFHYKNDPENEQSLSDNVVNSICEDSEGNLWIGTFEKGLNKFYKSTGTFKRYLYKKEDSTSLSADYITFVYCDSEGKIWAGTWNGGLNLYDKKSDSFIRFREKDGLQSDIVCGIGEDKNGNLWISTVKGISKFIKEKKEFQNYDISDGIQKGELNPGAFFINEEGWVYFGGTEGVNVFHPENLRVSNKLSPVVITSIKKFNEEILTNEQPPFLKQLEFSHDENVFSFELSSLDFSRPLRNQYAYRLEGFDKDWIYNGSRRFVTYTNLDPGEYIFKVKATNSDGLWNEKGTSLSIVINPPWWKTGWAYALYVVLIAAGLLTIRRIEKNRLKLRNEIKYHEFEAKKQREIEIMKSRFFANLSHEFRTPLMLIKGPIERLLFDKSVDNPEEQYEIIHRNSDKLRELIDQLLELSQLESASIPLKAKEENLINILRGLVYSFDSLANQKNINLTFFSSDENLIIWLDRDKLEKIINNLLSNAFKFTPEGGSIAIIVNKIETENIHTIEVKISDSGIGIPVDNLNKIFDRFYQVDDSSHRTYGGSGIGLALVKELVDLHKWKISVRSDINKGTEFTLSIPLGDLPAGQAGSYLSENEKVKNIESEKLTVLHKEKENGDLILEKNKNENEEISEKKSSLLIVEDSKDVRIYLSDLLKSNYEIYLAKNGEEGLKAANENTPDLIISDVMMPNMDGMEFSRRIKTDLNTSHIPVILLTAKVSRESKLEGLELGADDYIIKPFDTKELFIRIKNLLEQRKRLKEKFSKEIKIAAEAVTTNSLDNEFLNKAFAVAEKYLSDADFDSEVFAKEMFVSRSQLHRKLTAITGQAPGEFLRTFRLKKAAQMILEKRFSITQIAFEVGFNSPSHFTKAFQQHFGCLPSGFKVKV